MDNDLISRYYDSDGDIIPMSWKEENYFESWWGEPENKVIDAMEVIKDYCEKQDICNACPMFHICTQMGGKKRWIIPNCKNYNRYKI